MASETIAQTGTILSTEGNVARVAVDCSNASCQGCKISMLCSKSESVVFNATIEPGLSIQPGDRVSLSGRVNGWAISWLLLAGIPLIAVVASIVGGALIGLPDGTTGLIALSLVAGYYLLLWFFRHKIDRRADWRITSHIDQNTKL